jgi:hypothetical protein
LQAIVLGAADPIALVQAGARLAHLARKTQLEVEANRGSLQTGQTGSEDNTNEPIPGTEAHSSGTTVSNLASPEDVNIDPQISDQPVRGSNTTSGSFRHKASLFRRLVYPNSPPAADQPVPADAQQSSLAQAAMIEASRQAGTESAPAQIRWATYPSVKFLD